MKRACLCPVVMTLAAAACGGGNGVPTPPAAPPPAVTPPPAPPPAPEPPPPPTVMVSFEHASLTVAEGETVAIGIRYSIKNLADPLTVMVSPLDSTTTPDDYQFAATSVELPAAQEANGIATLALSANRDNLLSEGDETLSLRMVPPEGVQTPPSQEVSITIADNYASPCSGTEVLASPLVTEDFPPEPPATSPDVGPRMYTTEIRVRLGARDGARVWFEWESPYGSYLPHAVDLNVVDWHIESSAATTEHFMHIRWYWQWLVRLRFRSPDGACEGDPALVCTHDGCELQS